MIIVTNILKKEHRVTANSKLQAAVIMHFEEKIDCIYSGMELLIDL